VVEKGLLKIKDVLNPVTQKLARDLEALFQE
jgi:hypothetical protein